METRGAVKKWTTVEDELATVESGVIITGPVIITSE